MEFRPCIDIHNGKVKQIVGGSLRDAGDFADENFVSEKNAEWYAKLFEADNIHGAHVIMLNGADSEYYEATRNEALSALRAYPGGLQIGGGINADNAKDFIDAGASHVIVTSYAFSDGSIHYDNLEKLRNAVGKEHIVLDLSCKRKDGDYYVVTNRWQVLTDIKVTKELIESLLDYCDEFLVHGVDMEGKRSGIDEELVSLLASADAVITYAGGVSSYEDIDKICDFSNGKLNFTVGSALDIYGGSLNYEKLV